MVPDIGDISAGHRPTTIPTMTEAAVLEGTPCAPLPDTAAAYSALQPMDAPITPCTMTPTGTVTSHPTLTTSPTYISHTTPQTRASLAPATPTTQHGNISPEKPNNTKDPKLLLNPPIQRLSPSRIPLQIQTVTLILQTTRAVSQ